jgi:SAM-dependent methyltransferase
VHIVQANLYEPAFAAGTFDVVWSFGVLHHLPDPRSGFRAIARLARPDGGIVAIWVYGYEGMAFTYKLSHLRSVRRLMAGSSATAKVRVSGVIAALLSAGYWAPLWLLARLGLGRRVRRLPLSEQVDHGWSARVAAVHDRVATPITHFHDRPELEAWFKDEGFADIEVVDTNRRGWRAFGRRRPRVSEGSAVAAS